MDFETAFKIFMIFEVFQIMVFGYTIIMGQRKQTQMIEEVVYNPQYAAAIGENMLFGIMNGIHVDPLKKEAFFNFLHTCASHAFGGVKEEIIGGEVIEVTKRGKIKPGKGLADKANALIESIIGGMGEQVEGDVTKEATKGAKGIVGGFWK